MFLFIFKDEKVEESICYIKPMWSWDWFKAGSFFLFFASSSSFFRSDTLRNINWKRNQHLQSTLKKRQRSENVAHPMPQVVGEKKVAREGLGERLEEQNINNKYIDTLYYKLYTYTIRGVPKSS